jgi:hypothetical protein
VRKRSLSRLVIVRDHQARAHARDADDRASDYTHDGDTVTTRAVCPPGSFAAFSFRVVHGSAVSYRVEVTFPNDTDPRPGTSL